MKQFPKMHSMKQKMNATMKQQIKWKNQMNQSNESIKWNWQWIDNQIKNQWNKKWIHSMQYLVAAINYFYVNFT